MGIYYSHSTPFNFSRTGNIENISVTEAIWDQTPLTVYEEIATRSVHIDHNQYTTHRPLTLKVLIDHSLDFVNLSAYWDIVSSKKTTNADGLNTEYVLRGKVSQANTETMALNPDAPRSANNPYLKETPYIQISLPQAQDLIKQLKTGFSGTRLDMTKKILETVNNTITYDYAMVNENTVGTLKTSEIFEKRKGVCQHFANLFATLARGVGLPTRIITGFRLDEDSAGRHAWNEIEVKSGVWLPVEPQLKTIDFDSSLYIPMAISTLYDDPDNKDGYTKEIQGLILTSFKIESIQ